MATESSLCSRSVVIVADISSCSWSCSSCPASSPAQAGPGLAQGRVKAGSSMRRAGQLWSSEALWRCGDRPAQVGVAAGVNARALGGIREMGPQGLLPTPVLQPYAWVCCGKAGKRLSRLWTVLSRSESPPEKTGMFTQNTAILTAM